MYDKSKTIITSFVVIAMIAMAVPVMAFTEDSSPSDAVVNAGPYGEFKFLVEEYGPNGLTLSSYYGTGYNAAIAIMDASGLTVSIDEDYITSAGGFPTINENYGMLESLSTPISSPTQDATEWLMYYFHHPSQTWKAGFQIIDNEIVNYPLGFFKPFSDYDSEMRTANILFIHHYIQNKMMPSAVMADMPIVEVPQSGTDPNAADFAVNFYITTDPSVITFRLPYPNQSWELDLIITILSTNPYLITGYGSDTYLAFKNACKANNFPMEGQGNVLNTDPTTGIKSINTSYGSVQNIIDLEYAAYQDVSSTIYWYWSLYYGNSTAPTEYSDWLLGFMSPLDEAYYLDNSSEFIRNAFTFQYTVSEYPIASGGASA